HDDLYMLIARERGATKRCSACGVDHPITEFPFKSKPQLKLHSQCRAAQRQRSHAWYDANQDQHRVKVRTRKADIVGEVNALVDGWLDGRSCSCGATARLTAVAADGANIRRLIKDGGTPATVVVMLPDAV